MFLYICPESLHEGVHVPEQLVPLPEEGGVGVDQVPCTRW